MVEQDVLSNDFEHPAFNTMMLLKSDFKQTHYKGNMVTKKTYKGNMVTKQTGFHNSHDGCLRANFSTKLHIS